MQVAPLAPQLLQAVAKPPPGFRHAAGEFDWTFLSVQPHWPFGVKSILAWTDTQCVPDVSAQGVGSTTLKAPVAPPDVIGIWLYVHVAVVPGSDPAFG